MAVEWEWLRRSVDLAFMALDDGSEVVLIYDDDDDDEMRFPERQMRFLCFASLRYDTLVVRNVYWMRLVANKVSLNV